MSLSLMSTEEGEELLLKCSIISFIFLYHLAADGCPHFIGQMCRSGPRTPLFYAAHTHQRTGHQKISEYDTTELELKLDV